LIILRFIILLIVSFERVQLTITTFALEQLYLITMSYLDNVSFPHRTRKLLSLSSLFISTVILSSPVSAGPYYAGVDIMRTTVDVAGIDFKPIVPKARFGYAIKPKVMVEMQFSASGDDTNDNSTVTINDIKAAYVRLASNPSPSLRIHVLLGYAETNLQVSGANSVSGVYGGFSGGILLDKMLWAKSTRVSLEYMSYYNNNNVSITAIGVGVKHNF